MFLGRVQNCVPPSTRARLGGLPCAPTCEVPESARAHSHYLVRRHSSNKVLALPVLAVPVLAGSETSDPKRAQEKELANALSAVEARALAAEFVAEVLPSPATHAILRLLKAGESVFQILFIDENSFWCT